MALIASGVARIGIEEELIDAHLFFNQTLLAAIANDGLKILSVRFAQTVLPRIGPECFALFIPLMGKPRQRHDTRVDDALITDLLGLLECLGQAHHCPWILIDDLLA